MRGRLAMACAANTGGTLLAITSIICGPWAVLSGIRGRLLIGPPNDRLVIAAGVGIILVTFVDWTVRLLQDSGS